jgi:crossover junction endodeoxyribonuclease RuvC
VGQLRDQRRSGGEPRLIILGLDPSLSSTGWGIVRADGNRLTHIANGQIRTAASACLPSRLAEIASVLDGLIAEHSPGAAAAEEVFVNKNPASTLKLAQARGVTLMCMGRAGLDVGEYAPTLVKKAVVGTGGASKDQVHAMVAMLLPGARIVGEDASDALAVAITHAHHLASRGRGLL